MVGGYITVNGLGDITSFSTSAVSNSILLANDEIFNAVSNESYNYKWINDALLHTIRPSEYHAWTGSQWVLDTAYLLRVKEAIWREIKAYREARLVSGFQCTSKWWHSDDPSRIKYLGLLMLGSNIPNTLMWKTMDGTFVQMTQTLAQQIFASVAGFDSATFTRAEIHNAQMRASNDPISYDYSTGWPPIFGE